MTTLRNPVLCASLLLLVLLTPRLSAAQRAADPNAVDLTNDLQEIDSAHAGESLYGFFEIGDIDGNGDPDLLLTFTSNDKGTQSFRSTIYTMAGTSVIATHSINNVGHAKLAADLDRDGRTDLVVEDYDSMGHIISNSIHWAVPGPQFFDSANTTVLSSQPNSPAQLRLAADLTNDGFPDVLTGKTNKLFLYAGSSQHKPSEAPIDSASITSTVYTYNLGTASGVFTAASLNQLLRARSGWKDQGRTALYSVLIYPAGPRPLSNTPFELYTDTVLNSDLFVYSTPFLVYDFTGDGIDDFLVCDSTHIYVFKGGPTFGTIKLEKRNADFVITAPAVLDPLHYAKSTFSSALYAAGNLGSGGVPYLAVTGSVDSAGSRIDATFLYAGGSALDTYYDGIIKHEAQLGKQVVSSRGIRLVSEVLLPHYSDGHAGYVLLERGTTSLPHTKFSSVNRAALPNDIAVHYLGDHEIELTGMHNKKVMNIVNVLGTSCSAVIRSQAAGTAMIDLSNEPAGMYFILLQGKTLEAVKVRR